MCIFYVINTGLLCHCSSKLLNCFHVLKLRDIGHDRLVWKGCKNEKVMESVSWYRHTVFDSTTVSYEEKVQNIEKVFYFYLLFCCERVLAVPFSQVKLFYFYFYHTFPFWLTKQCHYHSLWCQSGVNITIPLGDYTVVLVFHIRFLFY